MIITIVDVRGPSAGLTTILVKRSSPGSTEAMAELVTAADPDVRAGARREFCSHDSSVSEYCCPHDDAVTE
jgi:hypothetical protein